MCILKFFLTRVLEMTNGLNFKSEISLTHTHRKPIFTFKIQTAKTYKCTLNYIIWKYEILSGSE